jgi:hypothetical protein
MPISLHFAHSLQLAGDSDVAFGLTTGSVVSPSGIFRPTGTPLNPMNGTIVLVGASRFRGGFLSGIDCSLIVGGTLAPVP